jgi:PAS domain S-box-containing protein
MTESAKSNNDVPVEAAIPEGAVPLESILCTEELHRRPWRPPDYGKENRALVALAIALADSPRTILQTLAEKALEVLQADSAGLSLLTKDEKRFYWAAIAGAWQPHIGGGTPRDFGPCGDVLDRNVPMLFTHWERRYPYLCPATPLAEEGLLVPFYVHGKAVGTIWAIAHHDRRKFDAEDLRLLESLGRFASAAYQALASIDDLTVQVAAREKAEAALRELANGLEAKVRRLVEANIIGIVIWNLDGQILEANDAFLRMVGYDREDLLSGRVSWREVTPDKWRAADEQALAELAATGVCEPFEKEYVRKDGSRVPVLVGAALFEGSGNEGVAFVLDLSEQKRSEEALRRSEYYLVEAQRLSHTGSWAFNVATREIVHWSQEHFRIFGFDPEDGMPSFETLMQRIHPDDRASAAEVIERGVREKTDYEQDFRIVLPDGTMRYMHTTGRPVFNSSGDPVEFVGTVMDVTERKLAENALRESQENLARTEQFSLVMATHTDLEGRWLKVPPTLCKLLGYTEEELLGRRFHEFTHPDDAEADWNQCSRLIRGEIKSFDLEKRYRRKDGSIVWVYLNVSVVLDASGAPVHFRTYSRDITQRKQREQALRQSEERYRRLAETATDVILTIDQTSTILFVNGAVEKAFGYTPAEIVGQKITALMPERMRHRHEEAMRRYLETGEKRISWNAVSLLGLHKNGREINLDVSFAEVGTGDERFFSGIVRDVTERKRAEAALHQAQAELAHVTRVATLGELTASIAHEINQPLGALVNSANACVRWLAAQNLERARQSALAVVADGQRAAEIIRRIRDLAKKAPLEKEWLDLNATIRDVIALARSAVQRDGVVVETHLAADVPLILGDRVQLQQVLLNLVMNAIEALRGVGVGSRALWVSSELVAATEVVIAVRDSGPGFEPQSLDRLFDAFYTTKPEGMGLGLAISRRIIAAHGGRLWATAHTPHGAVFQFTVPIGSEGVA